MQKILLQKLGMKGLILIGLVFFVGLFCLATQSPALASGAAALPLLFGMATGTPVDSLGNIRTVKYTHNAALVPGDVIVYNGAVLIAVNTSAANAENVFVYEGKVILPKEGSLAINAMDKVYWTGTVVNKTSSANTECGFCAEAAASADTTVTIRLLPGVAILDLVQSTQNTITDPGASGAIPVTKSGVCAITTAGAETRTLAIPGHIGQIIMLMIDTDGGSCVVTVAAAINQAGNNTITINDVNDSITLIAGSIGGALRWRVLANDGAALSTV